MSPNDTPRTTRFGEHQAANLRILRHEAETPMREHDADGECCLRAQLGADD